jgi:hypothetical protein
MKEVFHFFILLDKMITYMKDERNNLSILARALTSGVTCAPLALKAP